MKQYTYAFGASLRSRNTFLVLLVSGLCLVLAFCVAQASAAVVPAAPTAIHVTGATQSSVSLAWTAGSGATSYRLYRSGVVLATTTATSATWAGLNCGSTYRFSVQSSNSAGTSTRVDFSASTGACGGAADSAAPSTPSGLAASAVTATSLALQWSSSTDNVGVTGYTTYQAGAGASTGTKTSSTVSGLACGTSYAFSVDAYDAAGNHSGRSASLNVATSACADTAAPSVPSGLASAGATTSTVSLAWSASTDNVGVTGYTTYSNGTSAGAGAGTSYTVTGLACGTSYAFSVDAYDGAGNHSAPTSALNASTSTCPDTTAPSVPAGLYSTGATQTSVSLAWGASTDNVGVSGYTTYSNGVSAGTGAGTSSSVTGLACGTSYAFAVDAYDAAGNHSGRSAILNASTSACPDTAAPSVPAGLASTGATASSVSLGWSASTDNVGVAGYTTYRGGASAGTGTGTSYTVSGLACGSSYAFSVDAYDAAGNHSAPTATLNVSTSACPDTTAPSVPSGLNSTGAATTSVSLSWTASTDGVGVTGYTTYRGGASAGTGAGTSSTVTGLGVWHELCVHR